MTERTPDEIANDLRDALLLLTQRVDSAKRRVCRDVAAAEGEEQIQLASIGLHLDAAAGHVRLVSHHLRIACAAAGLEPRSGGS